MTASCIGDRSLRVTIVTITAGSYDNTVIIIYRESITSIPLPVTSIIHAGTGMVSFLCRRVVMKKKGKKEK